MDWSKILAFFIMLGINLGIIITLHIQTDNKLNCVQKQIKNFHGRLERQDADFKAHYMHFHESKKG